VYSKKTYLIAAVSLVSTLFMGELGEVRARAPEAFRVKMETSKGTFFIDVTRNWSPHGADQFYKLVNSGFYNDCVFFRVMQGFMAQVGINGNPTTQHKWRDQRIMDDPVRKPNLKGFVTFAKTGAPHSRTTQIFINLGDNRRLDADGFAPFGYVSAEGMKVVEALYSGYGEAAPSGRGPSQRRIQSEGNQYLKQEFPRLDYISKATIVLK